MERQSSVFGKLRSRANSGVDPSTAQDEWFIPYNANARPSLPTRESGIGLSPVPLRPAHNSLFSSVFSPSTSAAPHQFAENSRPFPRPTTTPANSTYLGQPSQRPMPRRTGTIVKSPSYSSISDMTYANASSSNRIPSSSSVPTGLTAPKMLFSPMERELRGGGKVWQSYSNHMQDQTRPRGRTVSAPRPSRQQQNPHEYRAEGRKWVVPTMCDMFVFPRPHLYPHAITPPDSPKDEKNRYSLITGSSDDDRVVEQGTARLREREDWAELVKRRGRSLSFGGRSSPPAGAPVIGNVRARSREASRSNSIVRRNSRDSQGRKRSASFGSRLTSRRSSTSKRDSEKSSFLDVQRDKQVPTSFAAAKPPSSYSRRLPRTSGQSFYADEPDLDDPFASTKPSDSPKYRRTHGYTKSDPESLKSYNYHPDSRYPSMPVGRTLQFRQPSVAAKGGVVIIPARQHGARRSAGGGTFRPPPPLDLSKPLPNLPDEAKSPVLPEAGPFFPLSEEIGIAISPGMRNTEQMENGTHDDDKQLEPKTAPLPVTESSYLATPRTARPSDGGSATARAFLAKQHQRARTKRAFQSPAQGPAYRVQRKEVTSPLSASTTATVSTSTSAPSPLSATSDGPRRKTALEEAIGRSRAASVGALDEQNLDVAKSALSTRPRTAENGDSSRSGQLKITAVPPPHISLQPPLGDITSMSRALTSPPLTYPISTMPSPRTVFTDQFEREQNLLGPNRPDMTHMDSGVSKTTVYTDASEGWSRAAGSGRSTPLTGMKPRLSETPPSDTPSPQQSMDDRDFQGLFFRTPHDRNGSFSQGTPLHERYAPPRTTNSVPLPRFLPERSEPIGLGYGLEDDAGRLEPQLEVDGDDQPRRPSDGSDNTTLELATPVIVSNGQQAPAPYIAVMDQARSSRTHLHERSRSSTSRLVAPFINGRPVTPESMTSGSDDEREAEDAAEGGLETQQTMIPMRMDGTEFPFPQTSTAENSMYNATATNATPDGKRRSSSISPPHLSPGTFGIISPPETTNTRIPNTNLHPTQPFHPSYSLSPHPLPQQRGSLSRSPQPDALSPTLGADNSPLPGHTPRHSAAVSFFDDFPSPPTLTSQTMTSTLHPQPTEKHASAFGQLVTGPPGAGKSTYCHGLHQFLTALGRPVHIINLDPAVIDPPYPCSISITELITLEAVQKEFGLGPNGAMLYCVEYLEANFDWLIERLDEVLEEDGGNGYVVFDTPGQVEIWTNHDSLKNVVGKLMKMDYRLAAVHLSDAHYITDASKFISVVLLALRAMLQMEMPHVNVLSKIDLLSTYGELPFDLSYYTEVQDLSYLLAKLNSEPRSAKFGKLNKAMVELVEEFGLVGFETLAVEDKSSMMNLLRLVDKMTGYIFIPSDPSSSDQTRDTTTANTHALFSSAMSARLGSDIRDVQERWLDNKEAWDEYEVEQWKKEGELRAQLGHANRHEHQHGHEE